MKNTLIIVILVMLPNIISATIMNSMIPTIVVLMVTAKYCPAIVVIVDLSVNASTFAITL